MFHASFRLAFGPADPQHEGFRQYRDLSGTSTPSDINGMQTDP